MSSIRQLFFNHVAQTSQTPMCLEISHAQGCTIFGTDGKTYLDFNSGISVSALGHTHPSVVDAVIKQASSYMHTMVYGEHIQSPQVEYAKLLSQVLNNGMDNVYFVNSGSEAVEAALKLARKFTGRSEIISCRKSYHGSTIAAESLRSDFEFSRNYFPGLPGIRNIDFNEESQLSFITEKTACIILEPIQGEAGVRVPTNNYLTRVREKCNETGTLMILDEIQTGFGRTGHMFAMQKFNIVPDILLLAKAMGGGMPLGGLVAPKHIMQHFAVNPSLGHITTFGGHPVCVAAALASLKVLINEDIILKVSSKEKLFKQLLIHSKIKEVRSSGLMMAVKVIDKSKLSTIVHQIINAGVLVDYFLFDEDSFRIAPPLIISEEQIIEGVDKIKSVLDKI